MDKSDYANFLEELVEKIGMVLDEDDVWEDVMGSHELGISALSRNAGTTMTDALDNFLQGWGFELLH